jgi:hypothetical protein
MIAHSQQTSREPSHRPYPTTYQLATLAIAIAVRSWGTTSRSPMTTNEIQIHHYQLTALSAHTSG